MANNKLQKAKPAEGDLESQDFGSGARFNSDKTRYELVPTHLLKSTADVFAYGAEKYAPWNWAKCAKMSQYIASAKRHLAAIEMGEDIDPESDRPHRGHLMCNLLMIEQLHNAIATNPELAHLDDRPHKWFKGQTY
jgi:hypothetical protein